MSRYGMARRQRQWGRLPSRPGQQQANNPCRVMSFGLTALDAFDPSRDRRVDGSTPPPRSVPVVMDLGFRSNPNLHRAATRPI